jgi:polysaccharide export outer membrane protein
MEEYVIRTGDILWLDVPRLVPKSPYQLKSFDAVSIHVTGVDDELHPIDRVFQIQPGSLISLGHPYGQVNVSGMTVEEAENAIYDHLSKPMTEEGKSRLRVSVSLEEIQGLQQIYGEHLVGPDGRVQLGCYGTVYVNELTLQEAKDAIEFALVKYLDTPEVSVTIYSYNTQRYYMGLQGAGFGDKLIAFPLTGNETVLDAFAEINGLDRISNSKRIRIVRPRGPNHSHPQILEVDWKAITAGAATETNYQIFPGDRIYVEEDKLVALDSGLSKIIAPVERVFGFALLGAQTVTRYSGSVLEGGGDRLNRY